MKRPISCFIVAMAAVLSLARFSLAQEGVAEFSIDIRAPQRARVGSNIVLDLTVTNISDHAIYFGCWMPCSSGEDNFRIDVFNSKGELAPRTQLGKAIRNEDQGLGPSIVFMGTHMPKYLEPKETLKATSDISQVFDLKSGVYTIKAWRPDFHEIGPPVITGRPEDSDLRKPIDPHAMSAAIPSPPKPKAIVRSNSITVKVLPD